MSVRELCKLSPIKHGGLIERPIDAFDKDVSKLSCCACQQAKDIIGILLGATVSLAGFAIIALIYWTRMR